MSCPVITEAKVYQNGEAIFMAQVQGLNGELVKKADVTEIDGYVVIVEGSGQVITVVLDNADFTIDVDDVVFDTPVTGDSRWTMDEVGYNFLYQMQREAFPQGGKKYRVEFRFTMQDGSFVYATFAPTSIPVYMPPT